MTIKQALLCSLLFLPTSGLVSEALAQTQTTTQTPASQQSGNSSAPSTAREPDLSITANVTARELRFEVVPNPTVEFSGKPERETVWDAKRENLPRPVQPGVTYRDIGIRLKITSIFPDIDRIVAEALGEVRTSDELPQDKKQDGPAAQPPPQPPRQSQEGRP